MCQLTLIDLKSRVKNSLFAHLTLQENSSKLHKDGFGFLTNKKDIFKSDKCASNVTNLASIITSMNISDEIILAHVRQISVGKVPKVEDSHPFKEKDFVLAHNGTLKWKDKKNEAKYTGIIDSEIFARELQEEYDTNRNFVECIQKTYAKFTGKFAFLIYNIREDCFYVVRGKTAKLHIATILKSEGEDLIPAGTVINTEIDSLRESLYNYTDILQLIEDGLYDFTIEEIKEETIYKYHDNLLEKVGEIKENYEVIVRETEWENNAFLLNRNLTTTSENKSTTLITRLSKFMDDNLLSFQDLDNILYCAFNKCLLDCTESDINMDLLEKFAAVNTSAKRKYWGKISYKFYSVEMYQKYELAYPYFLNDKRKLAFAFNKIRREEKAEFGSK